MASAHELACGRQRLRTLIDFALHAGWEVVRTANGALRFTKPGSAQIYTLSIAKEHRAGLQAHRRNDRNPKSPSGERSWLT